MGVYEALSTCAIVHAYNDFACANLSSRGLGGDYDHTIDMRNNRLDGMYDSEREPSKIPQQSHR
jgi:hypothetical protein